MGGGARRRGPGPELQWPRLRHPPGPSAVKGVSAPLQSLQLPARWPPGASHSRGVSARPRDGVPGLMGRGAERATAPPSPGGGGGAGAGAEVALPTAAGGRQLHAGVLQLRLWTASSARGGKGLASLLWPFQCHFPPLPVAEKSPLNGLRGKNKAWKSG